MDIKELADLKEEDIVEVNGVQLGFQVATMSIGKYEEKQQEILLNNYYKYLEQCKINGFSSNYVKMNVKDALSILTNAKNPVPELLRKVNE